MATKQKITPNLWFDNQAEDVVKFYTSVFKNSKIKSKTMAAKAAEGVSGIPAGTLLTIEFELEKQSFIALNGGPAFVFTPAISFTVMCKTRDEAMSLWKELAESDNTFMELGEYPFAELYGWTKDRYYLSWQVMYRKDRKVAQKIIPTLMFVGERWGKAEEAIQFYTSIFHDSSIENIARYGPGQAPDKEGTVMHGSFILERQEFMAMDSAQEHKFTFSEAISLMVGCDKQEEIDYYWEKLTAGGEEGVCGWLKDKYGVSWQVTPNILQKMLQDHDREKVERVTAVFLKMKKINIAELEKAYKGQLQAV